MPVALLLLTAALSACASTQANDPEVASATSFSGAVTVEVKLSNIDLARRMLPFSHSGYAIIRCLGDLSCSYYDRHVCRKLADFCLGNGASSGIEVKSASWVVGFKESVGASRPMKLAVHL